MRSNVTNRDKLNILWIISSPKVQSFLDRQPEDTMSNYHVLRQALITEFTIPESDQGLVFAAESKQVKHEASQAYDNRPRWTFLGACNDPDKRTEENLTFKTNLFGISILGYATTLASWPCSSWETCHTGVIRKGRKEKTTCGQVWWPIIRKCALRLTHQNEHTNTQRVAVKGLVSCSRDYQHQQSLPVSSPTL